MFLAATGGFVFVFIRAAVGAGTAWSTRQADRAALFGIGRFFAGGLMGVIVLLAGLGIRQLSLPNAWAPFFEWRHLVAACILGGAVSLVLTGWLIARRRGWLRVTVLWAAVLSLIVGGWFASSH